MNCFPSPRRTLPAVALLAVAVSVGSLPAVAQGFEGAITMRIGAVGPGASALQEIEYLTRAGKIRVNVVSPMGAVSIIGIPAEQKTYLLLDQQSMYTEMRLSADAGRGGGAAVGAVEPTIRRTGRKETIAGYECEHLSIGFSGETTDVCVTRGLGPFVNAMAAMGGLGRGSSAQPAWQRTLSGEGDFPLKVVRQDGVVQLEVTKIEKRSIGEALFTIPNSYTKMNLPRRPG